MTKEEALKLFENRKVRTVWDDKAEKWYFSVIDVVAVLTDSDNPRRYWSDLKRKLHMERSELYEKIVQFKMTSSDGKQLPLAEETHTNTINKNMYHISSFHEKTALK